MPSYTKRNNGNRHKLNDTTTKIFDIYFYGHFAFVVQMSGKITVVKFVCLLTFLSFFLVETNRLEQKNNVAM